LFEIFSECGTCFTCDSALLSALTSSYFDYSLIYFYFEGSFSVGILDAFSDALSSYFSFSYLDGFSD
jgi:hypothetical protein